MNFLTSDIEQSLNYFIRNGFNVHPHFYNCVGVDGFAIGQPRQYIGTYFLTMGIILLVSYTFLQGY